MRKTKLLSILIIAIMLLIAICPVATFAAETDMVTINFGDSKLAELVYNNVISNGATSEEISVSEKVLKIKPDVLNNVTSISSSNEFTRNYKFNRIGRIRKFKILDD